MVVYSDFECLLKLSSKQHLNELCKQSFQYRKYSPSHLPDSVITNAMKVLSVSNQEARQCVHALAQLFKAALFEGSTDVKDIISLFPGDFHRNLRDLLITIIRENMTTWKTEAINNQEFEARKRWKKLRDYFLKNHRDLSSGGGKRRKWYLYDRMQFVLPFINVRNTSMHATPISSDEEIADDYDNVSEASESSLTSFQPLDTSPLPTQSNTNNQPYQEDATRPTTSDAHNPRQVRTKSFPQNRSQLSQFEIEWLKAAHRFGEKRVEIPDIDEDEHFFKSLVPKMKQLSTIDKMECQAKIHNIVLQYIVKTSVNADQRSQP